MTWQERAACFDGDPRAWDTSRDGYPEQGKAICWNRCPVRDDCLAAAMREEVGLSFQKRSTIRGGLTPRQRAASDGKRLRVRRRSLRQCRECEKPVRAPRTKYCKEHAPENAEKRAERDRSRRVAA